MNKAISLFFSFIICFSNGLFSQKVPKTKIVTFELVTQIDPAARRNVNKAFVLADEVKADLIIIEMNTPGGLLNEADSIRTKIINSKIPVIVWINPNAASAGALISIACNRIYMSKAATIGAATVVTQNAEALPDKYQSYMRAMMRATAETRGRDPEIAEAMVGVSKDSNAPVKVLTLTRSEAIKLKFCDGEAESLQDVIKAEGISNYEIHKLHLTTIDRIINFLLNPFFHGILILLILGGIYYELQSPGIGFPLIVSIVAAVLFFAPLYLEQLAQSWEILVFIGGLGLIALELFVIPGFGIAGISGIALVVAGLILALVKNVYFDFSGIESESMVKALLTVLGSFIATFIFIIATGKKFITSKVFQRLVLKDTLPAPDYRENTEENRQKASLEGKTGKTITDMHPVGKIVIDGEIYEAITEGSLITKNTDITVIQDFGNKIVVRKKGNIA